MKISCKNLFDGETKKSNVLLEIEGDTILSVQENQDLVKFDYENICPGLVDIHINGGENLHFTHSPTAATIRDIEFSARKNGVAYTLPTVITSSIPNIYKAIDAMKEYWALENNTGVLGIHLEGPFLSVKKRGAHLEKYIIKPSEALLEELIEYADGAIKIMTIAPENFSDKEIKILLDSGIKISAGHSNASYAESAHAFSLGINLVTHLFNAMSAMGHRELGLAGASLSHADVYTPVILDDVHMSKEIAKLAYKLKKEKLILISDALFQNHKKQEFIWEEFDTKLINGNYINSDGNLAGATISLSDAVRNAIHWLEVSDIEAISMATSRPLSMIKTDQKIGLIVAGYQTKLSSFDYNYHNFQVIQL